MRIKIVLLVLMSLGFVACQKVKSERDSKSIQQDSVVAIKADSSQATLSNEGLYALALSTHSIQIITKSTGSTRELVFQSPFKQTVVTVERILEEKPIIVTNSECGAGVLKMASWDNGLTLVFQEDETDGWLFVGWAANQPKKAALALTTMAGIGVGSTRKETESVYVITVAKTTLGYEFSVKSNALFGIFDGPDENATITNMWSGVSCNFR
jgi:hypothetical protein